MLFGVLSELIDLLDPTEEDFAKNARRLRIRARKLINKQPLLLGMKSEGNNLGVTPLIAALMKNSHRCTPRMFKLLTQFPCDLNAAKNCGRTALHFLALHDHVPFLKHLLSNDRQIININATTKLENYTPVYMAALKAQHQALGVLTTYGASVNIPNKHLQTPLHMACFFGQTKGGILNPALTEELALRYVACMRILLATGAQVNAQDALGKTPLYYFSEVVFPKELQCIRESAFKLLEEYGAKIDAPSIENYTPREVAQYHGFNDFAQLLQESAVPSLFRLCLKNLIHQNADKEIPIAELVEKAQKLRLGSGLN